jgi:tetratricopeptide (TPR) repeat protein
MKPWAKLTPSSVDAYWAAVGDEIVARARAKAAPSAAAEERAMRAMALTVQREADRVSAGPAFWLTARERLGQALAAAGKPREALAELDRDLDAHPGRAIALLAAARAAKAAGDAATARARYAELAELWTEADADLPALAEVRAGAR